MVSLKKLTVRSLLNHRYKMHAALNLLINKLWFVAYNFRRAKADKYEIIKNKMYRLLKASSRFLNSDRKQLVLQCLRHIMQF